MSTELKFQGFNYQGGRISNAETFSCGDVSFSGYNNDYSGSGIDKNSNPQLFKVVKSIYETAKNNDLKNLECSISDFLIDFTPIQIPSESFCFVDKSLTNSPAFISIGVNKDGFNPDAYFIKVYATESFSEFILLQGVEYNSDYQVFNEGDIVSNVIIDGTITFR